MTSAAQDEAASGTPTEVVVVAAAAASTAVVVAAVVADNIDDDKQQQQQPNLTVPEAGAEPDQPGDNTDQPIGPSLVEMDTKQDEIQAQGINIG